MEDILFIHDGGGWEIEIIFFKGSQFQFFQLFLAYYP